MRLGEYHDNKNSHSDIVYIYSFADFPEIATINLPFLSILPKLQL